MNNVKDFGARGDGVSKDTEAIQRAIDAGGVVHFPAGTYVCGSLYLRSGTSLELESGAVIKGSPDPEDYNAPDFCPQNYACLPEKAFGAHLIIALEVDHVSIVGGRIDGNRPAFFDPKLYSRDAFPGWRPSQLLFFCESQDIRLTDVEINDAPYWACFLHGCQDVAIRGLKITNQPGVWNGDGIDIDCCRRVTVSDCNLDTSDDSLTIRAAGVNRLQHTDGVCEDVTVTNCILKSGQAGIRLGVGTGTIRHCTFSNIAIRGASYGICLLSTYLPREFPGGAEGVGISDIVFSNLVMDATAALDISSNWADRPLASSPKTIENIVIQNVICTGTRNSIIQGNDDFNVKNIQISDVSLEMVGDRERECPAQGYGEGVYLRPCAFYVVNVKDVRFHRCRLTWRNESERWRHGLHVDARSEVSCVDCRFAAPCHGVSCNRSDIYRS